MARRPGFQSLNERKQALIDESDRLRAAMRQEAANVRAAAAQIDRALGTARRLIPWVVPIAPLAGWLRWRRSRQEPETDQPLRVGKLLLRGIPFALGLWRRLSAARASRAEREAR